MNTRFSLRFEHLNFMGAHHQVCKLSLEAGSLHDVVINPMVVTAARFVEQKTVVTESVFAQPFLGDLAVLFCTGGEECDEMALIKPLVDDSQGIRIG